jgi:hypothetical protein
MHRLPWGDVDWFSVDSPGQDSDEAVDGLLVMVVAMHWSHQALGARDHDLKGREAAGRVVTGKQEAHRERAETDGFIGRIDVEADTLLWFHPDVISRRER